MQPTMAESMHIRCVWLRFSWRRK